MMGFCLRQYYTTEVCHSILLQRRKILLRADKNIRLTPSLVEGIGCTDIAHKFPNLNIFVGNVVASSNRDDYSDNLAALYSQYTYG